jgi:WASH complex subunit strumpellin
MDFLDEENIAGQTLLRLASRGSAIIAELLRLSDNIPVVFLPLPSPEVEKYKEILFDFKYLKSSDAYEAKIDKDTVRLPFTFSCSFHFDGVAHVVCVLLCFARACCAHCLMQELQDLDEEFRENHVGMLERFYQMFESVYKYIADLNAYIAEMADGTFVDYTIEVLEIACRLAQLCYI